MKAKRLFISLALLSSALVAGCSGGGGSVASGGGGGGGGGSAPVNLSLTDTPPPGVSVLSFEVTLTGATLQPTSGSAVPLLSTPIKIEVKRLETEAAFLSTLDVNAGTYSSITVNLANPELTILNTGAAFTAFGQNCGGGQVCEFKPNVATGVTFSGAPFPITIAANTPTGLLVDLNLDKVLLNPMGIDFSAAGGVTVTQLPAAQPNERQEDIDDVVGTVVGAPNCTPGNQSFVLHTTNQPAPDLTIKLDASTVFEDFNEIGLPNSCAGLVANQIVETDLRLLGGGTLLATKVELKSRDASEEEVEGVIVQIVSATQFQMVALEETPLINGLEVGNLVTVNIQSGASFRTDAEDLPNVPPAGSSFSSSADLLVGQNVQVRRRSTSAGTTIDTDRIRLRTSRFTATVAGAPSGSNFNVNGLPALFASATPAISTIQVQTSSQTQFEGVNGVGSLVAGNTVSLRGLLFKTAGTPVLVAKKVRKR